MDHDVSKLFLKRSFKHSLKCRQVTCIVSIMSQLRLIYFIVYWCLMYKLHYPSMFAVKAKTYEVIYNESSAIAFDETSTYCSAPKAHNFSAFHWSPHGILVSINQHVVTTRVVHLPKRPEISLITESGRSGPNHRIGRGCAGRA